MQVGNVLHAARWKCRTQKWCKNRHLRTIAQLCRAESSQLRHVSTIGKKLVEQQYLLQMFPQYGEHRPTNSWDRVASLWRVQGTPANFNGFCVFTSLVQRLAHRRQSPSRNRFYRWYSINWSHFSNKLTHLVMFLIIGFRSQWVTRGQGHWNGHGTTLTATE